jgi:ribosomal protein S12 methylthiotransferase
LNRIADIRRLQADAVFRSNFIVGYPGETEEDHDALLSFVEEAQLDWCGFFTYSPEEGTHAVSLPDQVPAGLARERHAELQEVQDAITAARRDAQIGEIHRVLVDEVGVARSHREAPEIDGVVQVDESLAVGELHDVEIVDALGPDLVGVTYGGVGA